MLDQVAYFPFGVGPHICISKAFAMMEIPLVIATMLRRYEPSYHRNKAK